MVGKCIMCHRYLSISLLTYERRRIPPHPVLEVSKENCAGVSLVRSMWCATSGQPEEEVAHSRASGPQKCHLDCWTGISPVIMMAGLTHCMCAYALLLVCHKTRGAGRQENHWWGSFKGHSVDLQSFPGDSNLPESWPPKLTFTLNKVLT